MPVTIGARRESDFTDPIGMLSDCHRRIERFLQSLITIAGEAQGKSLGSGQQAALSTSLRYFLEAAPKHTADEEESLFPRLRGIDSPEARAVLTRIEWLEADHARADKSHQEVQILGQKWLAEGQLPAEEIARFANLLDELAALYQRHIGVEDHEVFPSAKRLLSAAERSAIGAEMAHRRGIPERTAS